MSRREIEHRYYERHKEEIRARKRLAMRLRRSTAEGREQNRKSVQRYRSTDDGRRKNLESTYKSREKHDLNPRSTCATRAATAKYDRLHPEKKAARMAKRRAAKLRAVPPWITQAQLQEITSTYKMRPAGFHVDHIVPLQGQNVCGLHVPWNLQLLPASVNIGKGNRI